MDFLWIGKVYVGDVRANVMSKPENICFIKVTDAKMERKVVNLAGLNPRL